MVPGTPGLHSVERFHVCRERLLLHKRLWNSACRGCSAKEPLQAPRGEVGALRRSRPHCLLNPSCSNTMEQMLLISRNSSVPRAVTPCKTNWVRWEALLRAEVRMLWTERKFSVCQSAGEDKVPEKGEAPIAQDKPISSQIWLVGAQRWSLNCLCSYVVLKESLCWAASKSDRPSKPSAISRPCFGDTPGVSREGTAALHSPAATKLSPKSFLNFPYLKSVWSSNVKQHQHKTLQCPPSKNSWLGTMIRLPFAVCFHFWKWCCWEKANGT